MTRAGRAALPRTVIVFGLVSLLNDTASEMIVPILPIFLTTYLGAGPAVVGFMEGLAEATASILKLVSGRLADQGWNPMQTAFVVSSGLTAMAAAVFLTMARYASRS
jgi:hypothetical protein